MEEPGFEPKCSETPSPPSPPARPALTGPHRVVELSHLLRVLEVALAPVHLGALVGEDAGHGDAVPAARWLYLAESNLRA